MSTIKSTNLSKNNYVLLKTGKIKKVKTVEQPTNPGGNNGYVEFNNNQSSRVSNIHNNILNKLSLSEKKKPIYKKSTRKIIGKTSYKNSSDKLYYIDNSNNFQQYNNQNTNLQMLNSDINQFIIEDRTIHSAVPISLLYVSTSDFKSYILDNDKLYPVVYSDKGILYAIDAESISKPDDSNVKNTNNFKNSNGKGYFIKKFPSETLHVYKKGELVFKDEIINNSSEYKIKGFLFKKSEWYVSLLHNNKSIGSFEINTISPAAVIEEKIKKIYNNTHGTFRVGDRVYIKNNVTPGELPVYYEIKEIGENLVTVNGKEEYEYVLKDGPTLSTSELSKESRSTTTTFESSKNKFIVGDKVSILTDMTNTTYEITATGGIFSNKITIKNEKGVKKIVKKDDIKKQYNGISIGDSVYYLNENGKKKTGILEKPIYGTFSTTPKKFKIQGSNKAFNIGELEKKKNNKIVYIKDNNNDKKYRVIKNKGSSLLIQSINNGNILNVIKTKISNISKLNRNKVKISEPPPKVKYADNIDIGNTVKYKVKGTDESKEGLVNSVEREKSLFGFGKKKYTVNGIKYNREDLNLIQGRPNEAYERAAKYVGKQMYSPISFFTKSKNSKFKKGDTVSYRGVTTKITNVEKSGKGRFTTYYYKLGTSTLPVSENKLISVK